MAYLEGSRVLRFEVLGLVGFKVFFGFRFKALMLHGLRFWGFGASFRGVLVFSLGLRFWGFRVLRVEA